MEGKMKLWQATVEIETCPDGSELFNVVIRSRNTRIEQGGGEHAEDSIVKLAAIDDVHAYELAHQIEHFTVGFAN
jgi:hypothetical protein